MCVTHFQTTSSWTMNSLRRRLFAYTVIKSIYDSRSLNGTNRLSNKYASWPIEPMGIGIRKHISYLIITKKKSLFQKGMTKAVFKTWWKWSFSIAFEVIKVIVPTTINTLSKFHLLNWLKSVVIKLCNQYCLNWYQDLIIRSSIYSTIKGPFWYN